MNTSRIIAATALAAGLALTGAAAAGATQGDDHKPWICHPVEGAGETGYGWNLIDPDKASSHIDETTGAGFHTRKDGSTDVYADAAGHCPGFVPDPDPTPTEEPSPGPSETATPDPTPTETATPDPTPTETATPDPTPTETGSPDPTPTETAGPLPSSRPTPSMTWSRHPATTIPTQPEATATAPVVEVAPAASPSELAHTGGEWIPVALGAGLLCLMVGAGTTYAANRAPSPDRRKH